MSRQPCADGKKIELDVQITFVQFSTHKLQTLRLETRADAGLQSLITVITNGWPERQCLLPTPLRPYWSYRDELAVEDGLVLKGDRIFIPLSLQAETLMKLHESHQGIEKTRLRARTCVYWNGINRDIDEVVRTCVYWDGINRDIEEVVRTCVYWNGINRDIEEVVRTCAACQEMQRAQPHEPLMPHKTPTCAWQIVGTDLFMINRESYLIMSDYYSKFPFVYAIPSPVTSADFISSLNKECRNV